MNIFALFFCSVGEISVSQLYFFMRWQNNPAIQICYKQKHNPSKQPTSF